jgi:hypothetical protein
LVNVNDSEEDSALLLKMATEAKRFIQSFEWCSGVNHEYFGLGVGGVVAAFLYNITPSKPDVDSWLWVIVGDVPPAYIVTDDANTPVLAIEAYNSETREWTAAVKAGNPVDDLIPVNVPATAEWGYELECRLGFIEKTLLRSGG